MQNDKFFNGVGMWIWEIEQCEGGNVDAIINRGRDVGLSYFVIKAVDGTNWINGGFTQAFVDAFHRAGFKVYAWGYHYGGTQISEEIRLATVAMDLCDGYIIDAESEFNNHGDWASIVSTTLRNHILDVVKNKNQRKLLAYSTFGNPDTQSAFPYQEFSKNCDVFMPQMYFNAWNMSPVEGLNWAYAGWENLNKRIGEDQRPIIPTAPTYDYTFKDGSAYTMDGNKVAQIMQQVKGYSGINFWSYQHTKQDEWDAIRSNSGLYPKVGFPYPAAGTNSTPAPTPEPDPLQVANTQIQQLQGQLTNLNSVNQVLTNKVGELTQELQDMTSQRDQFQTKVASLQDQQQQDLQLQQILNKQIQDLRQELANQPVIEKPVIQIPPLAPVVEKSFWQQVWEFLLSDISTLFKKKKS